VLVPLEVREEFGAGLSWLEVRPPVNVMLVTALRMHLHPGEAAAIALAVETPDCAIILDDRKARVVARQFDIPILGTIGLLLRAKRAGIIPRVTPLLDALKNQGFYLSESLRLKALSIAQEDDTDTR
jgi:predicted nucleic acid-binding protein